MIFEETSVADIPVGAILAHSQDTSFGKLKKGLRLDADILNQLIADDIKSLTVAILEAGDLHEDEAAQRIARSVSGNNLIQTAATTGRVNLLADKDGLAILDHQLLTSLNQIDERITIATLPAFDPVSSNQMVATIKIIPFAVEEEAVKSWEKQASHSSEKVLQVRPYRKQSVRLIQTTLPGTSDKILNKTSEVLTGRLALIGSELQEDIYVKHDVKALCETLSAGQKDDPTDLIIISGASAITDRRDILPAALEMAGGQVEHVGMPVDPGNLLMVGLLNDIPVIGMPGCARSPKLNGFDWVLQRIACGLEVTATDIRNMGIGGLLKEIPSRPLPRSAASKRTPADQHKITPLILAAGQSTRMGDANKLLHPYRGKAMLEHVLSLVQSIDKLAPAVAVTGHQHDEVEPLLNEYGIVCAHNPDYVTGMSSSLRRGVAHLPTDCEGALILLGDMPLIDEETIAALIKAFNPGDGAGICIPTYQGQRGHPVLIASRFFPELHDVRGDKGARDLIHAYKNEVTEVPVECPGMLKDFDTREAFEKD